MSRRSGDEMDLDEVFQALRELREDVERRAHIFIEGTRKIITIRETVVPGFSEPFARKHGAWYDRISKEFVAAGFTPSPEFRSSDPMGRTPEDQSHYRFAGNADNTIWATYFLFQGETVLHGVLLQSWAEDGSVYTTVSGLEGSGVPSPPNFIEQKLPADIPVAELLEAHRATVAKSQAPLRVIPSVDAFIAQRASDQAQAADWRAGQGIALLEPRIRAYYKDRYEEEGAEVVAAILANPHWWTGEELSTDGAAPVFTDRVPLTFLMSRNDKTGRGHMTTFGLTMRGLRELQMKEVAANHCRAARFLLLIVANKLARMATAAESRQAFERDLGGRLTLTAEDVPKDLKVLGWTAPTSDVSVEVGLELEEFDTAGDDGGFFSRFLKKKSAALFHVKPAHAAIGNKDVWLRAVVRKLGLDAPDALPMSSMGDAMQGASALARRTLPDLRRRVQQGLPEGQTVVIKTGLAATGGGTEYVWVSVDEWREGTVVGTLRVEPQQIPGFTLGQKMEVAEADIFDRGVHGAGVGIIEAPFTDVVAQDYGVDLPG